MRSKDRPEPKEERREALSSPLELVPQEDRKVWHDAIVKILKIDPGSYWALIAGFVCRLNGTLPNAFGSKFGVLARPRMAPV